MKISSKYKVLSIVGGLLLFALYTLYTIHYTLPSTSAVDVGEPCVLELVANNAKVTDGLASAPITGSIKVNVNVDGTAQKICVENERAAFVSYKLPTYEDLKSIYFDQNKLGSGQKITLTGDQTQASTNNPINVQGLGTITLDAISSTSISSGSTLSWSHTVGSIGSDRFLLVGISIRDSSPPDSVNSITYRGQALTKAGRKSQNQDASVEIWYLKNPPTDTNTITATLTGTASIVGGAASWIGVNQTAPLGSFVSAGGLNTTPSVNVVSATGEVVVDTVARPANCSSTTDTVGSGQTQLWNLCSTGDLRGLGSSEPGAPSVTMSWNLGASEVWAIGAVPIKPSPTSLDKIYYITGNFTIDNNITLDRTGIIFVYGNLTINTNLINTNNNTGLVLVVKGDINIKDTVDRINAVLISQGTIYTAGAGCATANVPANQLLVNGSLISLNKDKPPIFCRKFNDNTTAAEKIVWQPKYLVILKDLFSDTYQKWSEIQ